MRFGIVKLVLGPAVATAFLAAVLASGDRAALARPAVAAPVKAARCSAIQNPAGDLLIVSDLPLHGAGGKQALQMTQAIAFELAAAGWRAGNSTLAYQSCDDSTAAAGSWDASTCAANAAAYAGDASVVAVIGPANSGCAQAELPVANRAANGPLVVVSPSTTSVGLTHSGAGTAAGEPGSYYPTGKRSFARVIAADDVQGAADATLAKQLGATKVFVLEDREAYGEGIAADTANAARKLGLQLVRFTSWDPAATSYSTLAGQIRSSGAQAVFLGGLAGSNGARLIDDIRAGAPGIAIIAPTGFTPIPAVVKSAGSASEGMYVSVAGLPLDRLPRAGTKFAKAFATSLGAGTVDPYAVTAAQAADVVLQAIADSNGTRSDIAAKVQRTSIKQGLTGPIAFDADGDLVSGPVTIYKIVHGASSTFSVITPKSSLLAPGG